MRFLHQRVSRDVARELIDHSLQVPGHRRKAVISVEGPPDVLAYYVCVEVAMATAQDAEIILKLYELRRETEMRKARDYITNEFWPESFEGLWREIGMTGDKYRWFRQVYAYWEMAAALAVSGAVDEDLFVTTQVEMIYTFAKISPFLKNFRQTSPDFMMSITTLCERNAKARERLERAEKQIPLFREKVAELKKTGEIASNRAASGTTAP